MYVLLSVSVYRRRSTDYDNTACRCAYVCCSGCSYSYAFCFVAPIALKYCFCSYFCIVLTVLIVFSSGPVDVTSNELMGNIGEVKGRDVVIVDELIDTGGTLGALPRRLKKAGAKVAI